MAELLTENAALLVKSKSADVEIRSLKKENKTLVARAKQFQSGVDQNAEHNRKSCDENVTERIYEVQNIMDHKFTKKQRKFLVHWKGYDSRHDSWEPETSLNCPKVLKSYLKSKNVK